MAAAGVGGYIAVRTGSITQPGVSAASPPRARRAPLRRSAAHPHWDHPWDPLPNDRRSPPTRTSKPQQPRRPNGAAGTARPSRTRSPPHPHELRRHPLRRCPARCPAHQLPQTAAAMPPAPDVVETPATALEAPARRTVREELTVPRAEVIGIRLDTQVSSETAKEEDRVTARVTRDVTVDRVTVIPAGAKLEGQRDDWWSAVDGCAARHASAFALRRWCSARTSNCRFRPRRSSATARALATRRLRKLVGAAVVGTILGSIFGGGKGAAIGGAVGAAGGTAAVMSGDRNHAVLAAGTPLTVHLTAPSDGHDRARIGVVGVLTLAYAISVVCRPSLRQRSSYTLGRGSLHRNHSMQRKILTRREHGSELRDVRHVAGQKHVMLFAFEGVAHPVGRILRVATRAPS